MSGTSKSVFVDTSSSVSIQRGIIEMGAGVIGVEQFLFGCDHLCYHPSSQCVRIRDAELSVAARRLILRENAIGNILREENLQHRR